MTETQIQCKRCLAIWDMYPGHLSDHQCEVYTPAEISRAFAEYGSPDSWGIQVIYEDLLINYLREQRAAGDGRVAATEGGSDTSRDWTSEPTAGELGLAGPPQLGPADYPEDHGHDPHCGLTFPHSPTQRCAGR